MSSGLVICSTCRKEVHLAAVNARRHGLVRLGLVRSAGLTRGLRGAKRSVWEAIG